MIVKKLLLSVLFFSSISAMAFDTLFVHTYGNNFENKGADIIYTSSSEYLAAGSTFNELNQSSDIYVLKLDQDFNKIWSFSYGTDYVEVAKSVVEMPNGNFLIAGYSNKVAGNGYDVYLLCLNANGEFLWEKTYGGSDWDFGYDIIERYDGSYYICGETQSYGVGEKDGYLIQVNDTGLLLNEITYGDAMNDVFYDMKEASDQSLYLVGESNSQQDSTDVYLVKLDNADGLVYENTYGSTKFDIAYQLDFAINGDIVLAGSSNSHSNRTDLDIMYYRLAPNGDSLLSERFAISHDPLNILDKTDEGTAILTLNNDNVFLAGYTQTYGFGIDKIAFSLLSNANAAQSVASPDVDYRVHNIIQVNDRVILVGSTEALGVGNSDMLIMYADTLTGAMINHLVPHADTATVSVNDIKVSNNRVDVYPNPTKQSFSLISKVKPTELFLFDLKGNPVPLSTKDQNTYQVPVGIPAGTYVLQLFYQDGTIIGKSIVFTD